jgi:hypothetical protein
MRRVSVWVVAAAFLLSAHPVIAQPVGRTVASFTVGVSTGEHQTGGAFGGTVLFNVNDWFSVEGNGLWLDRGSGADAFNVGASVLLNLASSRARGIPYFALGGSVHHATFDLTDERYFHMGEVPNAPGNYSCTQQGQRYFCGAMPMFYAQRMGPDDLPASGMWDDKGFTDPAFSFGGGLKFNLTDRLMMRPDLRALLIVGDGDTHTVGVFVVNFGYRF